MGGPIKFPQYLHLLFTAISRLTGGETAGQFASSMLVAERDNVMSRRSLEAGVYRKLRLSWPPPILWYQYLHWSMQLHRSPNSTWTN